jgi:hypothetical protein
MVRISYFSSSSCNWERFLDVCFSSAGINECTTVSNKHYCHKWLYYRMIQYITLSKIQSALGAVSISNVGMHIHQSTHVM